MIAEPKIGNTESEPTLKEIILRIRVWKKYLLSKWLVLLLAGLMGASLGLTYSTLKKTNYIAATSFVLDGGGGSGGLAQYAGMAAMVGIDIGGSAGGLFQGDNILELYKSRTMIAQTLLSKTYSDSSELLIDRYIHFTNLRDKWKDQPDLQTLDFRQNPLELSAKKMRLRDSILNEFTETINKRLLRVNKLNKKLSIIEVEVVSPDEIFSKAFNSNLVSRVNDFYIQTKTKKSNENVAILQFKVDSVRHAMISAIYSAVRVSDATPDINLTRQVQRVAPAQEAQFSAEANKAVLTQLVQNLEISKMNLLQDQPLIQLVDEPVYPLKVQRFGKMKGIVIGGFLFGFFTLLWLIVLKYYRDAMVGEG